MRFFTETQKFNQWWVQLLIYGLFLASVIGLFIGVTEISEGEFTQFLIGKVPPFIILAIISILLFVTKLQTIIDEKGIQYGFRPFQKKLRIASWNEIASVSIRKYKPLSEFGGWGYKVSLKGRGKVYNTKGNMGIQIVFKDGKKTLIGTQKPNEVKQIIATYTSKNNSYEI